MKAAGSGTTVKGGTLTNDILQEDVLLVVRKSEDGLRIPALVRELAGTSNEHQRRHVERLAKGLALALIDQGHLVVGDDYKVRIRGVHVQAGRAATGNKIPTMGDRT